jgi:hypothetical protein
MNATNKRRWFYLIALLAAIACAGSWAASQARSLRDRSEVARMTTNMKTVCVGRYLVDVPAQAKVSMSRERIDGFAIETAEESEEEFCTRVSTREAEIKALGADAGPDGPSGLVEARDLRIPDMIGRTLVFGRKHSHGFEQGRRVDIEWVSVESHAHTDGLSVSLSANYVDKEDAIAAEALLGRVRLRAQNRVPTVPGFCISHAVLAEPLPLHKTEHIAMHIGLPGYPDLAMTLFSMPGGGSDPSLVARSTRMDALVMPDSMLRISKLRSGRRIINGMIGEEVLFRAREFNLTTTYGFSWETAGTADDPLQPYLALELQTGMSAHADGRPSGSTLHEDALLSLWDRIASSIRPRIAPTSTSSGTQTAAQPHIAQHQPAH